MKDVVTDQITQVVHSKIPQAVQQTIYTNLDNISVSIADQKAHVSTDFTAGVKWGPVTYTPNVHGELTLANSPKSNTEDVQVHAENIVVNPAEITFPRLAYTAISRIARAVRRDVEVPKSLNLQDPLQNTIGGRKINGLFMAALNTQLHTQQRKADISTIGLQFTPQNTLKIDLKGGAFKAVAKAS